MHDNHYGAVTHLVTSFDDKYVVSGGADGNMFVFEGNFPTAAQRAEAAAEAKVNAMPSIYMYTQSQPECIHVHVVHIQLSLIHI